MPEDRGQHSTRIAWVLWCCLLVTGCQQSVDGELEQAEFVIDTFYSFDADLLRTGLGRADGLERALYYQSWAQAANYSVLERSRCVREDAGLVTCAIRVNDDFGQALGYTATDVFSMRFERGALASVSFEGDDPPVFRQVLAELLVTQPEVADGVCKDMFSGGQEPAACARAVVAAAEAHASAAQGDAPAFKP